MLPAVRRYISLRIEELHSLAQKRGEAFYILSGEYGLLRPEEMIPWYDHLLLTDEVVGLVPGVAASLEKEGVSELVYYTADASSVVAIAPYLELVQQACSRVGVELAVKLLSGDPEA